MQFSDRCAPWKIAKDNPVRFQISGYFATDSQSASVSWCRSSTWGPWPDFYYYRTLAVFLLRNVLPDERTVCNLLVQFVVTLLTKYRRAHDHILLSHTRLPQHLGSSPCLRRRVAQLYPQALTWTIHVKVILRPTVSPPVRLGVRRLNRTSDQYFPFSLWLFLDSCGFVDVERPLWR
jgi:hypothetical protein